MSIFTFVTMFGIAIGLTILVVCFGIVYDEDN